MTRSPAIPALELEERLRFETLIADLSSKFINLPAGEVDREILDAQRQICELLGLDFSTLWQWLDDPPGCFALTHFYSATQGVQPPEGMREDQYPWAREQLLAGRTIIVSSPDKMPPEAARDRETLRQFGIKSNLAIPLAVGGEPVVGVLGWGTMGAERDWPDDLIKRLRLLAQIFTHALARKRSELALRESAERLHLAAEAAEAGFWGLDCRTNLFWASDKARAMFGYSLDEVISMDRFRESVHPGDWSQVRGSIERAVQADEPINVGYRVQRGDGQTRWMHSRGRAIFSPGGEAERVMGVSVDITDRKSMEEESRASAARLAAGAELAGLGYYEVDFVRNAGFIDQRLSEICGLAPGPHPDLQFLRFWMEHVHPDDRDSILDERQKLHEGGIKEVSMEYRYLHPTQGQKWIHHLARIAERDAAGRSLRSFGVMQDITAQKKLAMQQTEDLQFVTLIADLTSRFVNLAPGAVDDAIEDTQRRICEILGLDLCTLWQWQGEAREILSMTHIHGALAAPLPEQFRADDFFPWCRKEVLAGRTIVVSHPDRLGPEAARDVESWGHFGAKSSVVFPLSTGGAPSIGALAFSTTQAARDWPAPLVQRLQLIAQIFASALARKRAEQSLRESEARLATGTDLAGLGYHEVDYGGRTCFFDDRFRQICGLPAEVKQSLDPLQFWSEHLHPDDRQGVMDEHQRLHEGNVRQISIEYRYLHPRLGLRWLHHLARVVERTADGLRTSGVVRDTTQQRQAELEARELRNNLTHLSRVNTLGELSGSLAHELNQPLGIILSNAQAAQEFLAQQPPNLAEVRDILDDIVVADRRASDVITRLRALLKRTPASLKPLALNEVINEVLNLTRADLIGREVNTRLALIEPLPRVAADRIQLHQLLLNLILNAADAMLGNALGERQLEIESRLVGDAVRVTVRDRGTGLPTDPEQLFQPFYTTKEKGLGMGLAICRSIVLAHQGRLWAEPNAGRGAAFHFELPALKGGKLS